MCAIHSTKETTTAESPSANTRVLRHSQIGKWSRTINTARLRSEKLNMRCTCCLFMLTLWSAAAGCNNRMPMCIGSFSLHSKWIGLSKRDPNSSVLRRDVESDRLIGNIVIILALLLSLWQMCSFLFLSSIFLTDSKSSALSRIKNI